MILCNIKPSDCADMTILEKKFRMFDPDYDGYQYFHEGDYCVPEREMNMFISANGGIDVYTTISVPSFMM